MTIPPGSGAVVMGTGIVSVALSLAHREALSRVVLVAAVVAWLVLAVLLGIRLARDRTGFRAEAGSAAGLTGVAATAVLGSRLATSGLDVEALVLLAVAAAAWPALIAAVMLRRQLPSTGSVFMLTVSVQSLSVLAAVASAPAHESCLTGAAAAGCALGIALYPFALVRFDLCELARGPGDQWIAGGALAISALASSEVLLAAERLGVLQAIRPALRDLAVVSWALGIAWLAALVVGELWFPRLRYDLRRWSTVFPIGMYAACSFQVARVARVHLIQVFASGWTWVGVAVWLVVLAAMLRGLVARTLTGTHVVRRRRHTGS